MSPSRKRDAVDHLQQEFSVSERRACSVAEQHRSSQRYKPSPREDEPRLVARMLELVREHPRFGYRRIAKLLQREGHRAGFDRVYRLWRREGLKVPQKPRKKRRLGTSDSGCIRHRVSYWNHVWTWDFIFDRTSSGSSLKWLSIIDEFTRECLTLKAARSIRSTDVIDVLRGLFVAHGVPRHIRSDNGPEFIAAELRGWLERSDVGPLYIAPGAPWENGYAERFHSRLRDEFLGCEVFDNVREAQALGTAWRVAYNDKRPHSSLGYQTPSEFARTCAASTAASATPQPPFQQHTSSLQP